MSERRERGHGMIYRRSTSMHWWCQFYIDGKRVRLSCGTADEAKARAFLRAKIRAAVAGRFRPDERTLRYEEMRAALLDDYAANNRKSHLRIGHLDSFFAGRRANAIRTADIRQFVVAMQKEGLANGTINRQLSALGRMLKLALIDERIAAVPYVPKLKEAPPRKGFLSPDDFARLLARLPDHMKVPAGLGHAGLRLSEALTLKWAQVDFMSNLIRLDPGETKSGEGREIPITPALGALLRPRRRKDFPFVCWREERDGKPVRVKGHRRAWERACVEAGLGKFEPVLDAEGKPVILKRCDRPRGKGKARVRYVGLIFHDLRRSAVRNLVESGLREKDAMAISGHKTRSVFDRYNIRTSKDVADAGERLQAYYEKFSHTLATVEGLEGSEKKSIN